MRISFGVIVVALVAGASGCAPKTAPERSPSPATAAVDPGPMSCPDSTDTPEVIANAVQSRFRLFRQNAQYGVPACVVEAVGRAVRAYPDSVVTMTLQMSDAILARTPNDVANLAGRLSLLSGAGRYRDVPAAFDALVRADAARANLENYRIALGATLRSGDTTARLRYLTAAARKFPRTGSIVADYNIQRQIPRLRALVDSSHQVLRLDSRRIERYATLASVYGNLDMPDSALKYTRRALTAGVPRNDVAPSLQSLIGVVMRKAQLLDDEATWESTLKLSRRIDSTLSTDASKHLIGLSAASLAAEYARVAKGVVGGISSGEPRTVSPEARDGACRRVRLIPGLLNEARQAMNQGGSRFSVESVPALQSGMVAVARQYSDLAPRCPG